MKRVVWKVDDVVLLKLTKDLFTIGQMLKSPYMLFFHVESHDGKFVAIDLNEVPKLFIVPVVRHFLQYRGVEKIKHGVTPRRDVELPVLWIRPGPGPIGGYVWKGGDLVRIDPVVGDLGMSNPVVKRNISPDDADTLGKYELTNVQTDHPLTPRLIASLREGRNVDPLKEKIFFGEDSRGIMK